METGSMLEYLSPSRSSTVHPQNRYFEIFLAGSLADFGRFGAGWRRLQMMGKWS